MLLRTPSKTDTPPVVEKMEGFEGPKPAFKKLGVFVSFVPDAVYGWPEEQIRRIRVHDPGFVPVLRRKAFLTPSNGVVVFLHHGVARFDRFTSAPSELLVGAPRPTRGYLARFPGGLRPNVIDRWFENPNHIRRGSIRDLNNLPPPHVPWGDWVEAWVHDAYWAATIAEKQRYIEEHGEPARRRKASLAAEAEANYRGKSERKYLKNLFSQWSTADHNELIGRQLGVIKDDPKPFVHLKEHVA